MSQKILVIGSGFNALATAYYLKKKGCDLKILFERNIKGVLGSVKIEGENFDLGYQFFDGLDQETSKFIKEMFSSKDLYNLKYGASTFSNNFLYQDHAIPYWPAYGKKFVLKAFIFYIKKFIKNQFLNNKKDYNNLLELYNELPENIRELLINGCRKHYQIDPDSLDPVAREMSTFTDFRQTLFNDKISNFLKIRSKFFDKHLASRRKSSLELENISLYPKGKNMEHIADKLIEKLKKDGVNFENNNFDEINISNDKDSIKINGENFNKVFITTNLSNTKRVLKINSNENYEHFISQVFIYFTVKKLNFNFQYTQINDINLYCSRISNCSAYSKITEKLNQVLIAEIPLKNTHKLWEDDEELAKIAWNEIIKCGIIKENDNYESVKILKIPKTFAVPKVNFFNYLNDLSFKLKNDFNENIIMIGQGIFTRHKFVKELLNKLKQ